MANFHVKDDFHAGQPVTAVPASWFNKVASFLNNLVGGYGIRIIKNDKGESTVEVDPNVMPMIPSSSEGDSPSETGYMPNDEVTQDASTLWEAGGANGARVEVFYRGDGGDTHYLYAARLTISKDGLITKIEAVQNGGMEIQA